MVASELKARIFLFCSLFSLLTGLFFSKTWVYFLPPMASGDDHRFFSAPVLRIADPGRGADSLLCVPEPSPGCRHAEGPIASPQLVVAGAELRTIRREI